MRKDEKIYKRVKSGIDVYTFENACGGRFLFIFDHQPA